MHTAVKKLALKSCLSLALVFAIVAAITEIGASAKTVRYGGAYQNLELSTYARANDYELHVGGRNTNTNYSTTITVKLRSGNSYGESTVIATDSRSCSYGQIAHVSKCRSTYNHHWGSSTQVYSGYTDTMKAPMPSVTR